jgi:hypothetical protein
MPIKCQYDENDCLTPLKKCKYCERKNGEIYDKNDKNYRSK